MFLKLSLCEVMICFQRTYNEREISNAMTWWIELLKLIHLSIEKELDVIAISLNKIEDAAKIRGKNIVHIVEYNSLNCHSVKCLTTNNSKNFFSFPFAFLFSFMSFWFTSFPWMSWYAVAHTIAFQPDKSLFPMASNAFILSSKHFQLFANLSNDKSSFVLPQSHVVASYCRAFFGVNERKISLQHSLDRKL